MTVTRAAIMKMKLLTMSTKQICATCQSKKCKHRKAKRTPCPACYNQLCKECLDMGGSK